jgi:hypothetical protein
MPGNEIVMRLQPSGSDSSNGDRTLHLGASIVTSEGGHYASVFVPAVRAQASGFGLAFGILMGYAVSHEISHCLLGPGHSYAGLMRASWNSCGDGQIRLRVARSAGGGLLQKMVTQRHRLLALEFVSAASGRATRH